MRHRNTEKSFKKQHSFLFLKDSKIIINDNIYLEKNPQNYDLYYDIDELIDFEYLNILETLKYYKETRNFYIPNTIIIRGSRFVEDGVYVYSYVNNILYRIKIISTELNNYLLDDKGMYITLYGDIERLINNYKGASYFKGVLEAGVMLGFLYRNNFKYNINEYNYNIYYFPKLQGIDITVFSQYYVLGVGLKNV